jgi:hypothetical protein
MKMVRTNRLSFAHAELCIRGTCGGLIVSQARSASDENSIRAAQAWLEQENIVKDQLQDLLLHR